MVNFIHLYLTSTTNLYCYHINSFKIICVSTIKKCEPNLLVVRRYRQTPITTQIRKPAQTCEALPNCLRGYSIQFGDFSNITSNK